MTPTRTLSALLSLTLCLTPALISSPVSAETKEAKNKKAKLAAAKKKAAPSSSNKKAGSAPAPTANQVWETPPSGDLTKTPPPPPVESKPESPPAAAEAPAGVQSAETPSGATPTPPPLPPPAEEEALPAFGPPPPPPPQAEYVEHLGPIAYPGGGPYGRWSWWPVGTNWGPAAYSGQIRGIYGGSLWLEPSFHGLQWPYMAKTGVGVSGSIWVDSGYEKISRGSATVPNTTRWLQQGRAVLRVTPTYTKGSFFIQGQVELVANGCQGTGSSSCDQGGTGTVDTDDLWLRFGHWNIWDIKVGRFEGWEVYHTGMGLDVNTLERRGAWDVTQGIGYSGLNAPDYYGVNFLHDRPRGMGLGYIGAHAYPLRFVRLESLTEIGTNDTASTGNNFFGERGTLIFDIGWLKLKGGAEYEKKTSGDQQYDGTTGKKADQKQYTTRKGYGGSVQFVFDPYVELGGNIAQGSTVAKDNQGSPDPNTESNTVTSVGGFLNVRPAPRTIVEDLMLGLGVNWTTWYGTHKVDPTYPANYADQLQMFGALQYLVAKQLFVKAVFAYARADLQPSTSNAPGSGALYYSNEMYSFRVRLMYLY
jgi:hypothetical protein